MDRKVLQERIRRKKRQLMMRRVMKVSVCVIAVILLAVFVVRGIILPIINRGGNGSGESVTAQAEETENGQTETTESVEVDSTSAMRRPVKGQSDTVKTTTLTVGWHEDENGRWYQNADGTYYAGGFQEIGGSTYYFNENGYIQTGWVSIGSNDYWFDEDGTYDPEVRRPMLALTFDDGPGEYTSTLLDCLEENGAHATFFMVGQNVGSYQEEVQRMVEIGCEIGNHSWDHSSLTSLTLENAVKEITDTDEALIEACGQAATVVRAPYGNYSDEIIEAVGRPFFMWSLDSLDWSYLDVELTYNEIMNRDLTDGSIILMHDIHETSVETALLIIPELIEKGYKLVTVSELAEAKNVTLTTSSYTDFWDSSLAAGRVAGYAGGSVSSEEEDASSENVSDGSTADSDISDGESTEAADEAVGDGEDVSADDATESGEDTVTDGSETADTMTDGTEDLDDGT